MSYVFFLILKHIFLWFCNRYFFDPETYIFHILYRVFLWIRCSPALIDEPISLHIRRQYGSLHFKIVSKCYKWHWDSFKEKLLWFQSWKNLTQRPIHMEIGVSKFEKFWQTQGVVRPVWQMGKVKKMLIGIIIIHSMHGYQHHNMHCQGHQHHNNHHPHHHCDYSLLTNGLSWKQEDFHFSINLVRSSVQLV